jgi:hypothetical protein
MKEFILETVFYDNESDDLQIESNWRVEEMTQFEIENLNENCFKEELPFEYTVWKKLIIL